MGAETVGKVALGVLLDTKSIATQLNSAAKSAATNNSAKKLGDSIGKSIGHSMNTAVSKSMQSMVDTAKSAFSRIGRLAATYLGGRALVNFGKSALELGSDLTEVQNVVDVVFGGMSNQVNEFAQNAMTQYGLSETMAKKFTGMYGAMAKSFGFTTQEAAKMGETLTGLAGDVASFYNISQDEAYTKLKSVFSGETETLKDLGIVMTQNALNQYAMANGYGKTTAAMTEQEKTALRYSFVLDKLSAAQGDFARTSDSWANQMRILALQFQSMKAAIGQGLINLFTPIIKAINVLLGKLVTLANAFKNFTAFITGKSSSVASSGAAISEAASSMGDLSDNTVDAGGSMSKTAKAAKEISRSVMGFDKLNKLSKNADDDNDGSSKSKAPSFGSLGGGMDLSGLVDTGKSAENIVSDFARKLKEAIDKGDWYRVGYLIGDKIADSLEKIQWGKIYAKEADIVKKITGVMNGLFDNKRMWADIGKTVGNGIGVVVSFLDDLVQGTNWVSLGNSLMASLMGAFSVIPWEKVGHLLTDGLKIALDMLHGFVSGDYVSNFLAIGTDIGVMLAAAIQNIDIVTALGDLGKLVNGMFVAILAAVRQIPFAQIGADIANGLNEAFSNINWGTVGTTIYTIVNSLIDMFHNFVTTADWASWGSDVGNMLATAIKGIDIVTLLGDLGALVNGIFDALRNVVTQINFAELGQKVAEGLQSMFTNLDIPAIGTTIGVVLQSIFQFFHDFVNNFDFNQLASQIREGIENCLAELDPEQLGGDIQKLLQGIMTILQQIPWDEIANTIMQALAAVDWGTLIGDFLTTLGDMMPMLLPILGVKIVESLLSSVMSGLKGNFFTDVIGFFTEGLGPNVVSFFSDTLAPAVGSKVTEIGGTIVDALSSAGSTLTGTVLPAIGDGFSSVFGFIAANPVVLIIGAIVGLVAFIATKGDEIQEVLRKVQDFVDNIFSKDLTDIFGPVLGGVLNKFRDIVKGVFDGVMEIFNGIIDFIRGVFTGDWERAWKGVTEVFGSVMDGLEAIIKTPLNAVISLVNKAIGALNMLHVNVPSAIAKFTGFSSFGFNIPQIPMLAQGGYVKANTPQLAMIGDNRHEGEIVAPESKITAAVNDAVGPLADAIAQLSMTMMQMQNNNGNSDGTPVNIYLDGQCLESVILGAQDRNRLKTSGSV